MKSVFGSSSVPPHKFVCNINGIPPSEFYPDEEAYICSIVIRRNENSVADTFETRKAVQNYFEAVFTGKEFTEDPEVDHLHGVPGAGKTKIAWSLYCGLSDEKRRSTIWNAYDEFGVIEHIPLWQRLAHEDDPYAARLAARDVVRDASAVGRDMILNRAILGSYHAIIDTTNSSPHSGKVFDLFEEHGKRNNLVSVYAPFEISLARCLPRRRAIDVQKEFIEKRPGAMTMLRPLSDKVLLKGGYYKQLYNPSNESAPQLPLHIKDGKMVECRRDLLIEMRDHVENDVDLMKSYIRLNRFEMPSGFYRNLDLATESYVRTFTQLADGNIPVPIPGPTTPVR